MSELIDISDDMTPTFFKDPSIKRGCILTFNQNGVVRYFKIIRLNRKERVCKVRETIIFTGEEIDKMSDKTYQKLLTGGNNV